MEIELRLRASLAAREPTRDLAPDVMTRVRAQGRQRERSIRTRRWRVAAALVATLVVAAAGLHWHGTQQRTAHNYEQLLLALAITGQQLDQLERRLVRTESLPAGEDGT